MPSSGVEKKTIIISSWPLPFAVLVSISNGPDHPAPDPATATSSLHAACFALMDSDASRKQFSPGSTVLLRKLPAPRTKSRSGTNTIAIPSIFAGCCTARAEIEPLGRHRLDFSLRRPGLCPRALQKQRNSRHRRKHGSSPHRQRPLLSEVPALTTTTAASQPAQPPAEQPLVAQHLCRGSAFAARSVAPRRTNPHPLAALLLSPSFASFARARAARHNLTCHIVPDFYY